jgi:hypothetical protein
MIAWWQHWVLGNAALGAGGTSLGLLFIFPWLLLGLKLYWPVEFLQGNFLFILFITHLASIFNCC